MPKTGIKKELNIGWKRTEICNEYGKDVSMCKGLFVDRVIDFDDYKTRKRMNKLFPKGDYIYWECEAKLDILIKYEHHNS